MVLTLLATWISAYVRQSRHFDERPRDLFLLPVFTVLNTFLLMPIRIYGFMRMAAQRRLGDARERVRRRAHERARPNPLRRHSRTCSPSPSS